MKFDLTFGVVLSFFVPGILFLTGIVLISNTAYAAAIAFVQNPSATQGAVVIIAALIIGVVSELLRGTLLDPIVKRILKHLFGNELPNNYFKSVKKDNIDVFNVLLDSAYSYYRLSGNSVVSVTVVVVLVYSFSSEGYSCYAILAPLAPFAICCKARYDTNRLISDFVTANPSPETTAAAVPAPPPPAEIRLTAPAEFRLAVVAVPSSHDVSGTRVSRPADAATDSSPGASGIADTPAGEAAPSVEADASAAATSDTSARPAEAATTAEAESVDRSPGVADAPEEQR